MITVPVNASSKYDILIGRGILPKAGSLIRETAGGEKALVVTDSNVDKYHSEAVIESLRLAGYEAMKYVIPAGEDSKNMETLSEILSFMAANHLSRKDVAVALGGGVVGDITGFAAAVYMRGIRFVQIPTTVLAAVDSSVGGKTAVDLPEGKNLAGAFHQPALVICDTDTFATLPERDFNNGFAEVIKYGMIADYEIFDMLDGADIEEIIRRCVEIKAEIVEEDEFESGRRQILNFGHSIGHAYEKLSEYSLLHGEAVSCGMVKICEIAEKKGMCSEGCTVTLKAALKKYKLPLRADYSRKAVAEVIRMDKKAAGDYINLIMPTGRGEVAIVRTGLRELESLLDIDA
ncbi:MAG: 3-dehydroquinate synthase [Lentihominibacter sp.]